jgi:hypothetical protein
VNDLARSFPAAAAIAVPPWGGRGVHLFRRALARSNDQDEHAAKW